MSKAIEVVLNMGGYMYRNSEGRVSEDLAIFYCTKEVADIHASHRILDATYDRIYGEWVFPDGSILHLWDAGIYSKLPWYFMAYSCENSKGVRERRANPTPDTSHEG